MSETIIKTAEQVAVIIPEITDEKEFSTIKPHIEFAEESILLPLIGEELLQYLRNYTPDASGSASPGSAITHDIAQKLIKLCSAVTAYSFAFEYSKTGDVNFTSMGMQGIETGNFKGVFEYQKRDVMNAYAQKLDQATDSMLLYLEKVKPAMWPAYLRTDNNSLFINNAADFSRICNIFNSRRTFLAIKPIIEDVEISIILPITGKVLFDILKQPSPQDSSARSTTIKTLKAYAIRAIANRVIADALDKVSLRLFSDGVSFASFLGIQSKDRNIMVSEKDNRKKAHLTTSESYLTLIRKILEDNAPQFPEYTPLDSGSVGHDNTGRKHFLFS